MPRKPIFLPSLIPQIQSWRDEGLSTAEIADKLGCSLGTLRVRCSQLGIPLRRPRKEQQAPKASARQENGASITISLHPGTVMALREQAASRGATVSGLAAILLEAVANDGLYGDVLDED